MTLFSVGHNFFRSMSALAIALILLLGGCSGEQPQMAPPTTSIGYQEEGFFRAQVFYATDRASEQIEEKFQYTGRRGGSELAYGSVEVSIPDSHQRGRIESKSRWKFWESENPTEHVLVLSIDPMTGRVQFASTIKSLLTEVGRDDVLVFVHGFNVTFDEAAKRTAQMAYDLEFTGAPIFYSWPSRGGVADYPADEASVQWTAPHFQEFLGIVLTDLGAKTVHLIVHSMGNRAVVPALSRLDLSALPEGSAQLRQIVLAAPDMDAAVFEQFAATFPGKAKRITLYTSSNDKAILASQKLHQEPRAGGSIVVIDGVDTIDASNVNSDFLSHSYFGSAIISDVKSIIGTNLSPAQRCFVGFVKNQASGHWEYDPVKYTATDPVRKKACDDAM